MQKKALIAMSGGVDSSVAAYLMQKDGFACIGVTMKLIAADISDPYMPDISASKTCCSLEDTEDARSVAYRLGFPYYVYNFTDDFRAKVIDHFVSSYENGQTPNPCIDCNRYLKFDRLYHTARELGCDYIVTGHYARIAYEDGRYLLKKALDEKKDQSYVLYTMTQEQLKHTCFPLGGMHKEQIRRIAAENGFINADKPDSQDICFVPDGDYVRFMESYTGHTYPEGNFVDTNGNVLGKHRGAVRYTIGQRKGLGIGFGVPMYVCGKNMRDNTVTLGSDEELYQKELLADHLNWIAMEDLAEPMRVSAKIRYRHKEQPATAYPHAPGQVRVVFDEPQRAPSPGQAVVFYRQDTVVGGGTICTAE